MYEFYVSSIYLLLTNYKTKNRLIPLIRNAISPCYLIPRFVFPPHVKCVQYLWTDNSWRNCHLIRTGHRGWRVPAHTKAGKFQASRGLALIILWCNMIDIFYEFWNNIIYFTFIRCRRNSQQVTWLLLRVWNWIVWGATQNQQFFYIFLI